MDCAKHVLGVGWERHSWRRRVSSTKTWSAPSTDMWGRTVSSEYVACHKQDVCDRCGATREGPDCTCDAGQGACCAPRLAYLRTTRHAGS
jgi:hypothetical protein